MGGTSSFCTSVPSMPSSNKTRKFQRKQCWEYGIIYKYASFTITDNTPSSKSTKSGSWNRWKIRMAAKPLDKIIYNKVSKYTMAMSLFSRNFIPKPKTCRITLKIHLEILCSSCISFLIKAVMIFLTTICNLDLYINIFCPRPTMSALGHLVIGSSIYLSVPVFVCL